MIHILFIITVYVAKMKNQKLALLLMPLSFIFEQALTHYLVNFYCHVLQPPVLSSEA